MGGLNVKNTMVERVLQILAPHPCLGCGKVGSIVCEDCKYDISNEPFFGCILCGMPNRDGICNAHESPIKRAFVVGQRSGTLEDAINSLKFNHVKAAARPLAALLDARLPYLSSAVEIVPIPTVRSHVRQRGYDQAALIAYHIGVLRELPVRQYLRRITKATQHVVGKSERLRQANRAFALTNEVGVQGKAVLLVDDVVTTGSTLEAAARLLSDAGATVWVAVLAHQPLD